MASILKVGNALEELGALALVGHVVWWWMRVFGAKDLRKFNVWETFAPQKTTTDSRIFSTLLGDASYDFNVWCSMQQ